MKWAILDETAPVCDEVDLTTTVGNDHLTAIELPDSLVAEYFYLRESWINMNAHLTGLRDEAEKERSAKRVGR